MKTLITMIVSKILFMWKHIFLIKNKSHFFSFFSIRFMWYSTSCSYEN